MTAVQNMFFSKDEWELGKLRNYCYSPAINESLNQSRMKRTDSICRSSEMQICGNISVEFHRAHVWIVVIFHFVSDIWHSLNCVLVWHRPISLLLFCVNEISLSQGHESAYVGKVSCCFLSTSSGFSSSQISLGIQDHMTWHGAMNWLPSIFDMLFNYFRKTLLFSPTITWTLHDCPVGSVLKCPLLGIPSETIGMLED